MRRFHLFVAAAALLLAAGWFGLSVLTRDAARDIGAALPGGGSGSGGFESGAGTAPAMDRPEGLVAPPAGGGGSGSYPSRAEAGAPPPAPPPPPAPGPGGGGGEVAALEPPDPGAGAGEVAAIEPPDPPQAEPPDDEAAPPPGPDPARDFPWPPPTPSTVATIPLDPAPPTAGALGARLEAALTAAGYFDRSWWRAPGGFALVTRLERIAEDGAPAPEAERWPAEDLAPSFELGTYLRSLFFTDPGRFRVIVFALSDRLEGLDPARPAAEAALGWLREGLIAPPPELDGIALTARHRLVALIYEFEKPPGEPPVARAPGRLTGRTHLERARLWAALAAP